VECVYNGEREGSLEEEAKYTVETWGLSKVVRNLLRRGVNRQDVWEVEEELAVCELGRRMVAEES
jgi:hypothetical protein